MKKLLAVLIFGVLFSAGGYYSCAYATPPVHNEQAKQQFESRLNLTEKQKKKAKAIHQKGFKQMKSVMEQVDAKRKELEAVKKSEDPSDKEKAAKLKEELKSLRLKAREIRKQNSKDFEKILTNDQKKELEKMKAEGRAKFHKKHPPKHPFKFLDCKDMKDKKGLFPPQTPPEETK